MEAFFRPLVLRVKAFKVLIVGLPGSPLTSFPSNQILNNKYLASVLSSFLTHAAATSLWGEDSSVPKVLYTTGNGSNIGLYFMYHYLTEGGDEEDPALHINLKEGFKTMMLVNSFTNLDKNLKSVLRRLLALPGTASLVERSMHISALCFSTTYLEYTSSRKEALKEFYSTRSSWRLNGADEIDVGAVNLLKVLLLSIHNQ
jgi:hypothetical protein